MRVLSPVLRQAIYPALRSAGYFKGRECSLPAVLTYHGVIPDNHIIEDDIPDGPLLSAEKFRNQISHLKKNYSVISPQQLLAWLKDGQALPSGAVLLTCDDGLLNHHAEMLPILQEENLSCLFFVTSESAGETPGMLWYVELFLMMSASGKARCHFSFRGTNWDFRVDCHSQGRKHWMELVGQLSEYDAEYRQSWLRHAEWELEVPNLREKYLGDATLRERFALMNKSQLRELARAGMTIGAHTCSHPLLAQQDARSAEYEIGESRRVLAEVLACDVWSMAYPFGYRGAATEREFELAQSAGYQCAFLNCGGPILSDSPIFALPRIHVTAEMRLSELEAHISGFHTKLRQVLQPA